MIKKISLKNEVDINGQKVNELNLNFLQFERSLDKMLIKLFKTL